MADQKKPATVPEPATTTPKVPANKPAPASAFEDKSTRLSHLPPILSDDVKAVLDLDDTQEFEPSNIQSALQEAKRRHAHMRISAFASEDEATSPTSSQSPNAEHNTARRVTSPASRSAPARAMEFEETALAPSLLGTLPTQKGEPVEHFSSQDALTQAPAHHEEDFLSPGPPAPARADLFEDAALAPSNRPARTMEFEETAVAPSSMRAPLPQKKVSPSGATEHVEILAISPDALDFADLPEHISANAEEEFIAAASTLTDDLSRPASPEAFTDETTVASAHPPTYHAGELPEETLDAPASGLSDTLDAPQDKVGSPHHDTDESAPYDTHRTLPEVFTPSPVLLPNSGAETLDEGLHPDSSNPEGHDDLVHEPDTHHGGLAEGLTAASTLADDAEIAQRFQAQRKSTLSYGSFDDASSPQSNPLDDDETIRSPSLRQATSRAATTADTQPGRSFGHDDEDDNAQS